MNMEERISKSREKNRTTLETEHLYMRPIHAGDEIFIFPEVDTELTKHWIGWEPPADIAEVRTNIENFEKNPKGMRFMVFNKAAEEFVGNGNILEEDNEYQVELWVKASMQRQGYGKEILNALISWARDNINAPYIAYSVTEGNTASQALIEKLKLTPFREFDIKKRGKMRHVRDYKILLHGSLKYFS